METFSDLVEKLDQLTNEEILELKLLLEKKWIDIRQQEIVESLAIARNESAEGKTIVLSSPEEIKGYFSKMMGNYELC